MSTAVEAIRSQASKSRCARRAGRFPPRCGATIERRGDQAGPKECAHAIDDQLGDVSLEPAGKDLELELGVLRDYARVGR